MFESAELGHTAASDMVDRTSTRSDRLMEANDKLHARINVLKTICDRVEAVLGKRPRLIRRHIDCRFDFGKLRDREFNA